jgi:GTPase SAR1 family protein
MHGVREFNILIIGKSGSGKSATTKLLTGIPSVKVGNSLKEVTTEVNFYRGASLDVNGEEIRFQIMDIPGLDKINNRAYIREHILDKLEEHSISLNAILYISSLTERDTVDQGKLFSFL